MNLPFDTLCVSDNDTSLFALCSRIRAPPSLEPAVASRISIGLLPVIGLQLPYFGRRPGFDPFWAGWHWFGRQKRLGRGTVSRLYSVAKQWFRECAILPEHCLGAASTSCPKFKPTAPPRNSGTRQSIAVRSVTSLTQIPPLTCLPSHAGQLPLSRSAPPVQEPGPPCGEARNRDGRPGVQAVRTGPSCRRFVRSGTISLTSV